MASWGCISESTLTETTPGRRRRVGRTSAGTAAENPPMIDRRCSITPPTCSTALSIEAVAPGSPITMTCALGAESREAAEVLGAPTATASPRISAMVRARRPAAVPRFRPLPRPVFTSGSFLDLPRAITSIGRPTYSGSVGLPTHRRIDLSGPSCGREQSGNPGGAGEAERPSTRYLAVSFDCPHEMRCQAASRTVDPRPRAASQLTRNLDRSCQPDAARAAAHTAARAQPPLFRGCSPPRSSGPLSGTARNLSQLVFKPERRGAERKRWDCSPRERAAVGTVYD